MIKLGKDGLGFLIVKLITRYLYTGEQIRVEKISRKKKKKKRSVGEKNGIRGEEKNIKQKEG